LLKDHSPNPHRRSEEKESLLDMFKDIGTLVWRLERRFDNKEGELPRDLRRATRDLESMRDSLEQRGFEIKDHTGQDYDGGMLVKVITSQPVASLTHPQIIETLKPTIYYHEKIIQMGDVIVGVPEDTLQQET